jgi:LacI family transcriptional regulator
MTAPVDPRPEESAEPAVATAARRRATIRDVARAAGVNPSTVSRVLNGQPAFQVSEDVRRRVVAASQSLGYEPSRFARALRTRRSYMLALGVPNVADPFFSRMFSGAADEAERDGYTLVLTDQGGLERAARRASDLDGLLIATARRYDPFLAALRADGAAFVLVNRRSEEGPYATVRSDDVAGSRLVVDHLVALGHRHIGHLGGNEAFSTAYDRRQGYLQAMAAHGLAVRPQWLAEAGFTPEEGARAADRLLALAPGERPTAIVAVNDLTAVGLLARARELGLRVPEELSIVGFDDVLLARYAQPPLTTVVVAAEEMGRLAVRQLLDGRPDGELVLPVHLEVRASTAPPTGPAP